VFQVLSDTNFDFMGARRIALTISGLLCAASIVVVLVHGLNLGIEFKGGTEIQLKFPNAPDLIAIRSTLSHAGLENCEVTRIGDPADNEVYIRVGRGAGGTGGNEETRDVAVKGVLDTLRPEEFKDLEAVGVIDINTKGQADIAAKLLGVPGMTEAQAEELARNILKRRTEIALFTSLDELADVPGMTPDALAFLRKQTTVGPFALRSQSYIGPAIGSELVQKATWAIIGSLAGMLVYIWIRFQFQWGLAAVIAVAHDTVITLGLFSLFDKEMSLSVVAAFLTLIGYSVNDTVVIFDRIREILRSRGSTSSLTEVVNLAVNRTLSRTIITSGLTWIAVLALYLFGGDTLNPFAFVMTVGIVVGSYSTIYIASPILVIWQSLARRRSAHSGSTDRAVRRTVKKVPSAR
jgi:preprotein translocase subunit SecF